jgi:UDP-glucose:(heptosyl)LPS alpha-1,3-glucosyltransferase
MKIALVTWSYDEVQGISRCVSELACRLAPRHDVHVFATKVSVDPPAGVTAHEIPLWIKRNHVRDWEYFFRAGVRLRRERFDVVHLHFPIWARAQVFTCHGVARAALAAMRRFPREGRENVPLRRLLPYYTQIPLYARHLRDRTTIITAVSEKARSEVVRLYRQRRDDIQLIFNGVDLDRFGPSVSRFREPVRRSLGLKYDQFVLLFVGNHFRHKGARYAIEVVDRLPENVVLLVVGDDSPERIWLDDPSILERLRRSDRVRFVGLQPEIWKFHGAADAVLFPSLYESAGLVVLEAMASGLPIIAPRTVAMADELVEDGVNGFVVDNPWDVEGMAERIRAIMADRSLYDRIVREARKTVEAYSWDEYARKTEAVYETAMKHRENRRAVGRISRARSEHHAS